jgi:hypothetical protein
LVFARAGLVEEQQAIHVDVVQPGGSKGSIGGSRGSIGGSKDDSSSSILLHRQKQVQCALVLARAGLVEEQQAIHVYMV